MAATEKDASDVELHEKAGRKPPRFTDTTLRDGHQSTLATRLRGEDIFPVAEEMDKAGFWSMEVWGGATFDVPTRFLNEDPWERLKRLKSLVRNTPLQMLLRGQNLVGYRQYADDVVEAFVDKAAEHGIDVFRIFDALNDERNFISSYRAIKKAKKHIQGTICYSLTQRHLGGEEIVFRDHALFVKMSDIACMRREARHSALGNLNAPSCPKGRHISFSDVQLNIRNSLCFLVLCCVEGGAGCINAFADASACE